MASAFRIALFPPFALSASGVRTAPEIVLALEFYSARNTADLRRFTDGLATCLNWSAFERIASADAFPRAALGRFNT